MPNRFRLGVGLASPYIMLIWNVLLISILDCVLPHYKGWYPYKSWAYLMMSLKKNLAKVILKDKIAPVLKNVS